MYNNDKNRIYELHLFIKNYFITIKLLSIQQIIKTENYKQLPQNLKYKKQGMCTNAEGVAVFLLWRCVSCIRRAAEHID